MNYASISPPPNTPEARLANKQWRTINSWWILPPVLSCSLLCWLGFLVAAIRTGERRYWIWTGVYSAVFAAFMFLILIDGPESTASDIAVAPFLVGWIAPTVHAAIWNRQYLRTLAAKGNWYSAPLPATQHNPTHYNTAPTTQQPFLGVNQNDYYAPPAQQQHAPTPPAPTPTPPAPTPAPGSWTPPPPTQHSAPTNNTTPIDITTVTAPDLAESTGISRTLADRIIAVRDARGGYRDIDDLAAAANLQPHELVRLRNRLTFAAPENNTQNQHNTGNTGRILDI